MLWDLKEERTILIGSGRNTKTHRWINSPRLRESEQWLIWSLWWWFHQERCGHTPGWWQERRGMTAEAMCWRLARRVGRVRGYLSAHAGTHAKLDANYHPEKSGGQAGLGAESQESMRQPMLGEHPSPTTSPRWIWGCPFLHFIPQRGTCIHMLSSVLFSSRSQGIP